MKKIVQSLAMTTTLLVSAQADFLMSITDENGIEENLCVKSYSYSNNLESLHKKKTLQSNDIYSRDETLTKKTYLNEPVYRKVVRVPRLSPSYTWRKANYTNPPTHVKTFLSAQLVGKNHYGVTRDANSVWKLHYEFHADGVWYSFGANRRNMVENRDVVIEYTKTADAPTSNESAELITLVHYLPSDADTDEYITKSTKNLKIGFFENYTYDSSINSCTKN